MRKIDELKMRLLNNPNIKMFAFPFPEGDTSHTPSLSNILESDVPEKYFLSEKAIQALMKYNERQEAKGNGFRWTPKAPNEIQQALKVGGMGVNDTVAVIPPGGTKNERYKVGYRIRRLTCVETLRLHGFADDWADHGINDKGDTYAISDTGKYQCAGNAVTVNVIEAIITRMLETGCLK